MVARLGIRKRMERCLLSVPSSGTYVGSTALPFSTRMMIRLNAMPCGTGDVKCLLGFSGFRGCHEDITYDNLDGLKENA